MDAGDTRNKNVEAAEKRIHLLNVFPALSVAVEKSLRFILRPLSSQGLKFPPLFSA